MKDMKQLLENYIKYCEDNKIEIECIALGNKDGVILEHHFVPSYKRNIYSHSKSFTSTLVGIAIDEGKLTLDTKLVDVFKDECDEKTYQYLNGITVRALLTMSSGFNKALLMGDERKIYLQGYPDYLKFFLSQKLEFNPGEHFCYSNADTHMLSLILKKVYNMPTILLAYEKLFKPLGIPFPVWGTDPQGNVFGASDLHVDVVAMNKLGQLFLNKGTFNGKRVVSEEWIEAASKVQIKTENSSDENWWEKGYGYQVWIMNTLNAFRFDGMYGQISIVMPEDNYVISFQRPDNDNVSQVVDSLRDLVLLPYLNSKNY